MSDPNLLINVVINWVKSHPIVWVIPGAILAFFIWYKSTQLWNGIGNFVFATKMSWQGKELKKELDSAEAQKKEIDKTLTEYAVAKKELESIKVEKDRLEKVFNDQSKTAAEKVAEFRQSAASEPEHTATDNVTTESLCARARAIGASAATVAAVCGQ
ncbi:MAG TPA: hypothetical protein VLB68_29085 [Pyrinomonadaceae bacterium]|nr:hypothetical protein [Pyrinomonadaceae bacterium]